MANVRFSDFIDGGEMQIGDIPVGLRATDLGNNYKFNFPGSGIKDSSGNYLFRYSTVGAIATNALQFINSVSGNPVVITASGTDPNIGITISPLADGVLTLDTLAWPTSDGLPNSFLFTDGLGHLHFTNGSVVTTITGTQHQVLVNGTFGIPQGGPVTLSTPQDIDINSSPTFILTNCTGLPLTTGVVGILPLANGGTNANLTASNGGIIYSTATAFAVLAGTLTPRQILQSGSNSAPSWSTATYPATTTLNQLLYSSANNTITGLATVNRAVLITNSSGVPGFTSTMTDGQIVIGATVGIPTAANLTAGTDISIVNGPNSITINAIGAGVVPSPFTAVNDTNVTMTLTGSPSIALLQAVTATMGWAGQLSLARGGTNAALTASNGGIVYSTASALAILAGTATANQVLLSGSSAAPSWSTATYPTNTVIDQLLYSVANNTITGLPTVDKAVLTTDSGGAPNFVAIASNGQLIIGSTSGIPAASTLTAGTNISIVNGPNSITINAIGAGVTPSPFAAVNDTNVTMTLTGTPATALLQSVTATMGWAGQLSLARGGTNAALTASNGGIVYSTASALAILASTASATLITNASGIPVFTSSMTNGQVVIGSTGATPTAATLTAGTNITITNGAGSITINATGAGVVPAALTAVNDTNVTLSLTGTPSTALLQAVTATMGWSGTLSLARGGTGTSLSSTASATLVTNSSGTLTFTSTMTNGQVVIGSTGATPTAATLTAGSNIAITNGAGSITVGFTGILPLANGGTNANLTASNGGIIYSTASAFAVLAGTATANQVLLSGSSAAPSWSTATYPATTTINQLLYSSAANTIAGLATANSAMLVTTSSGVPGFTSTMTNGQVVIGSTGATPTAATLTAGSNISITNGAGSITIAVSGGATSGRLLNIQTFINNGTYTPTASMAHALIQCIGGGGGGGGGTTTAVSGGGGSGSFSQSFVSSGTIGGSQTVTVGAGGAGGVTGSTGSTGANTSVGTIVIALGGLGGTVGSLIAIGGAGGGQGTGDIALPGDPGGCGLINGSGQAGGAGGSSVFGGGALWRIGTGNGNNAISGTGAGGSGTITGTSPTGGTGGSGIVIIYEYS